MRLIWWLFLVMAVGCAKDKKPRAGGAPDPAPLSLAKPAAAAVAVTPGPGADASVPRDPSPATPIKVVKGISPALVGSFERSDDGIADFVSIDLMADGTFDADLGIVCSDAPCPSTMQGKWTSSEFTGTTQGTLTVRGTLYQVELLPAPRHGMRLTRPASGRDRARAATFEVGGRLGRKP